MIFFIPLVCLQENELALGQDVDLSEFPGVNFL